MSVNPGYSATEENDIGSLSNSANDDDQNYSAIEVPRELQDLPSNEFQLKDTASGGQPNEGNATSQSHPGASWIYDSDDFMVSAPHLAASSATVSDFATLVHILKAFCSVGLLAVPYAVSKIGFIPGLIGIPIVGMLMLHCMRILTLNAREFCKLTRRENVDYGYALQFAFEFGPPSLRFFSRFAKRAINVLLGIMQVGVCCVCIVFIADNLEQVINYYAGTDLPIQVWMAAVYPVLLGLCCIREIQILAYASGLALVIQFAGFFLIFVYCGMEALQWNQVPFHFDPAGIPVFLSAMAYCFEGTNLILHFHNRMSDRDALLPSHGVLNTAIFIVVILQFAFGFFGFITFGNEALGSITLNMPNDNLYQSLKFLFAMAVTVGYALQFMLAHELLYGRIKKWIPDPSRHLLYDYVFRVCLVTTTTAAAMGLPHLGPFVSLIGASFGFHLCLTFPAFIDLLYIIPRPSHFSNKKYRYYGRIASDLIIIIVCMVASISGVVTSIFDIVEEFKK